MRVLLFLLVVLAAGAWLAAQERDTVPKDSTRLTMRGCAKDRVFTTTAQPEHEPVEVDIPAGRRFRLQGPRQILDDIKRREGSMVQVTGLVRKAALSGPGGVKIFGGRIRIGGALPQDPVADPRRDPMYNVVVIDVESFQPLLESCETR
jgi:hypothetical protein